MSGLISLRFPSIVVLSYTWLAFLDPPNGVSFPISPQHIVWLEVFEYLHDKEVIMNTLDV